jgi:hypothetical protein
VERAWIGRRALAQSFLGDGDGLDLDIGKAEKKRRESNMVIRVLQIIAAVGTILTGLVSLLFPRSVTGFIGLDPVGGRGITEIRAVLGGFFIALGALPLILNKPTAYKMLGFAYLTVAVVRTISMFIDRSVVASNWISIAFEVVFGVILIL